jgi:hypothetical protein
MSGEVAKPMRPIELKGAVVYSIREGWFVDPDEPNYLEEDDFDAVLAEVGFSPWSFFKPTDNKEGLKINVYRRQDAWPHFAVEIDASDAPAASYDVVYAEDLPSVMDLLRAWVPVTQASRRPATSPRASYGDSGRRRSAGASS